MQTTNLFVELIVIGVGTAAWVALLALSLFGAPASLPEHLFSTQALVPLLVLVYLLGILTDRAADWIFQRLFGNGSARICFDSKEDYFSARRTILMDSERLSGDLRYDRSRLRICRGWALNAFLIAICLSCLIWARFSEHPQALWLSIGGTLFFLALSAACIQAWRALRNKEYRKTKRIAKWLQDKDQSQNNNQPTVTSI